MRPGTPALCRGTVLHRRTTPTEHEFTYPVSQVWIDPDRPEDLCEPHPLWSHRGPAPARFRRKDYGRTDSPSDADVGGSGLTLSEEVRSDLTPVLGDRPLGAVRMLTQVRRWGWLFNPITVFFAWAEGGSESDAPVGAVLEVTNTPWHERHRYPIGLTQDQDRWLRSTLDKQLHVSPFLGMDYQYRLRCRQTENNSGRRLALDIDVVDVDDLTVIHTALRLDHVDPTRDALTRSLRSEVFPTHRVSLGIHTQAARLLAKRVPFVPHPARRSGATCEKPAR